MADEDEIDILGDFQLDTDSNLYDGGPLISQNSELLNFDYTIHPQWLLDRPSTNPDNWYDTNVFNSTTEKSQTPENDALGHLSTENCITDESGWTEKEKNLLERGMEIFGKSSVRLSQFIGSKSAPEVKYYLKNFYLENHSIRKTSECALEGDVLDDAQIPASIEEVIAAVSTAKPTVQVHSHRSRKKSNSTSIASDLSEREVIRDRSPLVPIKKKTNIDSAGIKNRKRSNSVLSQKMTSSNAVKFKIKSKLKAPFPKYDKVIKQKTVKIVNAKNNENEIKRVEITTGHGLAVPICEGEEIVKIKNTSEDSDTDVDIDVEMSDEESNTNKQKPPKSITEFQKPEVPKNNPKEKVTETFQQPVLQTESTHIVDLSGMSVEVVNILKSMEEPKKEIFLKDNCIIELEKVFNKEYFSGGSYKTPERYLKIRTHILNGWLKQKPKYLNKTISRQGLKNFGDVNCFGRIHCFLEQIGAINFGCEQVNYERPLLELLQEKLTPKEKKRQEIKLASKDVPSSTNRIRMKPKFINDGEGGYTMSHDEHGHVIKHTVINEDPIAKPKAYIKKPPVRLIYCRPFKDEIIQPYTIRISLSTLLIMDLHAHTCFTEVMGLIAGYWSSQNKIMVICHYEPCLNMASSTTHCDMCPISQAKAADAIHGKGLDLLGWFHSHPTFAPEPSNQDLETQQYVQQWIGQNKPCIGMIMSPFSLNGALIASPFRCLIVDKKVNFEDQLVPYKFKVDVVADDFQVENFFIDLRRILRTNLGSGEKHRIDFLKPYFQSPNITFLEKYITSVRMHLAKLGTLSKSTCENAVNGIISICMEHSSK
ncbi:unnamed protein product [Diabrotica balteata]|uniref:Myb-like, SWIRM and MPN domain-containing protein 1 n=1 Tax=Diabrotica balteata TaxID=107213 RepID=A0A9N9T0Y6_DIABA|nr:unnamed protein product [Diabrotica balteata]